MVVTGSSWSRMTFKLHASGKIDVEAHCKDDSIMQMQSMTVDVNDEWRCQEKSSSTGSESRKHGLVLSDHSNEGVGFTIPKGPLVGSVGSKELVITKLRGTQSGQSQGNK